MQQPTMFMHPSFFQTRYKSSVPLPDGPWMAEENDWLGLFDGFPVQARRNMVSYTWCGYLMVPQNHPWHGQSYDDIEAQVHGGLTFASEPSLFIGVSNEWAVGFDCAHAFDFIPIMPSIQKDAPYYIDDAGLHGDGFMKDEHLYRGFSFVQAQLKKLAEQAAAARHFT